MAWVKPDGCTRSSLGQRVPERGAGRTHAVSGIGPGGGDGEGNGHRSSGLRQKCGTEHTEADAAGRGCRRHEEAPKAPIPVPGNGYVAAASKRPIAHDYPSISWWTERISSLRNEQTVPIAPH